MAAAYSTRPESSQPIAESQITATEEAGTRPGRLPHVDPGDPARQAQGKKSSRRELAGVRVPGSRLVGEPTLVVPDGQQRADDRGREREDRAEDLVDHQGADSPDPVAHTSVSLPRRCLTGWALLAAAHRAPRPTDQP